MEEPRISGQWRTWRILAHTLQNQSWKIAEILCVVSFAVPPFTLTSTSYTDYWILESFKVLQSNNTKHFNWKNFALCTISMYYNVLLIATRTSKNSTPQKRTDTQNFS